MARQEPRPPKKRSDRIDFKQLTAILTARVDSHHYLQQEKFMTTKVRLGIAGIALAAGFASIYLSSPSYAGGDKDLKTVVRKIADAIKKGDKEGAKKLAAAAVKNKNLVDEITDVMHMFRPRKKGGMGIGEKAGSNPVKDGIEITLRDLGRDVPGNVGKQAEALETTGYWIAAISELSTAKGWPKDQGKKTKKSWNEYSEEMSKLGVSFAKAAAGKGAGEIKTAAAKLNENCNRCHSIFKE
jgi:hypothetical protein